MKKLLFTIIMFCTVFALRAQVTADKGAIKGIVIDSAKNSAMGYATVSVSDAETKLPVKSSLTKENGNFELSGLPLKKYVLTVVSVGYQTKTIASIDLKLAEGGTMNLSRILLSASTSQLNEVKITSTKPLVKQEIDRISYDVQADPESKAQTAMDMLRKLPLVSVDGDDNIQLQGSGSYRIFINGKPSALLASNPKDVLRSMPASTIVKIEVITTPPAKYDAEGLAGIINIITTKATSDGYNGTLSSRINSRWGPNINLTATAKKGKFGVSGYLGTGRQFNNSTGYDSYRQTYSPASMLVQNGTNSWGGHYVYGSTELSYEIDTLNLLTASLNYNNGKFTEDYDRYTTFTSNAPLSAYRLLNDGNNSWNGTDLSLNYQLGFKRNKQQLLTASYRYVYSANGQASTVVTEDRVNYSIPNYNQQNDAGTREHTFQLDYVHPLKDLTIEAGAKAILRNNFSNTNNFNLDTLNNVVQYIPNAANDFTYHQNVYSAYNSYTYKIPNWTFKGGARFEYTHVDADFSATSSSLNMNYSNLVPSLSIMRSFKKNQSLTFGYTNRLERPGIWQLNPFVDRTNPQIISTGNPNLRPVVSNLFELSYTKSGVGNISTRLSYMYSNNSIVSVTRLLSDTLTLNTYENAGKNKIARWNINGNYPLGKKLNINFNTGLFYVWINGTYNGTFYSNKGPRTNSFANLTYKPGNDWTVGASGGYNRRLIFLQGGSNDFYYSSFSVGKSFLKKNLTLTAITNNPWANHYSYKQFTSTPDFYQQIVNHQLYRTFSFSVSYKFGKLSSDIKKNQRSINNDDVSSKGN